MLDKNFIKALTSAMSFCFSMLICSCVLISNGPSSKTEVAGLFATESPTLLPVPDKIKLTATPTPTDTWVFYEDSKAKFSFYHPAQWTIEEAPDPDRIYLGDQIIIKYGEVDRYWVDCGGDCPMVEKETNVNIGGLLARKLTGYIGSVGGYVPQEYVTYIIEYRGGYLIFTLYALGLGFESDQVESIWPLNPDDVEIFDRIIASLELHENLDTSVETTPTTTAESFPQGSSY